MSALIRFYFVIFLVLLQLIAPLIHAHKNDETEHASFFHLPEFEQVDSLLKKESIMIAPSFHEGEIITVSSGVRENQRRFLPDDNFKIVTVLTFLIIFVAYRKTSCSFFIQTEPIKRVRFCNPASSPRAPPLKIMDDF